MSKNYFLTDYQRINIPSVYLCNFNITNIEIISYIA